MFQSLFCWMLFWKQQEARGESTLTPVSILILLDVVLEVESKKLMLEPQRSFNPYSVGCCSGSARPSIPSISTRGFQSLFCWMLFWKFPTWFRLSCEDLVSILILLDVVLEVIQLARLLPYFSGFQSLFCWMLFWKSISSSSSNV